MHEAAPAAAGDFEDNSEDPSVVTDEFPTPSTPVPAHLADATDETEIDDDDDDEALAALPLLWAAFVSWIKSLFGRD